MLYFEILKVALSSLGANPMRSMLTMLGIIIGVAAVIVMVALGTGAQAAVEAGIESLGTNLLTIRQGWNRGASGARMRSERLRIDDARALQQGVSSITAVVPVYEADAQVEYGNTNLNTEIVGTWGNWAVVNNWDVPQGRFFTQMEAEGRRRVAVLGSEVVAELFPEGADPVGAQIRIRGVRFDVIGVLGSKGAGGPTGRYADDDWVVIPLSTSQWRLFGTDRLSSITVQVQDESLMTMAMVEIETALRREHRLRPDEESDFRISTQAEFLQVLQESQQAFTTLLAGIAAVSLVVGGIGIMNIMLVSVTERTREVGIRRAIGAKRGSIKLQFLIEAVVLSCAGGLIGVALAWLASSLLAERLGWQMMMPPDAIILSFSFAALIGVVFGFYPAVRASRLDPIEALRYE